MIYDTENFFLSRLTGFYYPISGRIFFLLFIALSHCIIITKLAKEWEFEIMILIYIREVILN
jgi:hypothetical protein